MKGFIKNLLVGIVVLVVIVLLGKNLIAKAALSAGIKMVTGLNAQVAGMQVGLLRPVLGIQGLKIMNPAGYPDPVMVHLNEFFVDYNLQALLSGKAHLRMLRLDLDEVTLVKRADGQTNINQIKILQQKPGQAKSAQQKVGGKAPQVQIDALELRIGKVLFKDYTRQPASVKTFELNIKEHHEHVNPYSLVGLVVLKIMAKTGLAAVTGINVADLQAGVNEALRASTEQFNQLLKGSQAMGQNALKTTREMISQPGEVAGHVADTGKQAVGAAKDAAESLKKLFKN